MAVSAPTERKLVSQTNVKSAKGGKGGSGGTADGDEEEPKKSKMKLIIIIVVVLLAAGGGAYFFLLKPKPVVDAAPKPGVFITGEAMTLNLKDGHYLKMQVAIQLVEAAVAPEEMNEGANAVIDEFSNRAVADVSSEEQRDALKKDLLIKLQKAYPKLIYGVNYIQFVTQ